jgi:hypothetical protein
MRSRDRSVGTATRLRAGQPAFDFRAGARYFSLLHSAQTGSETHPLSYPMVLGSLSREAKQQGREVDKSPPSSVEVKKLRTIRSPTIFLHGIVLTSLITRIKVP